MAFIGALERVRADDGPRFLVKGGVSIERLGLRTRATKDSSRRLPRRDGAADRRRTSEPQVRILPGA